MAGPAWISGRERRAGPHVAGGRAGCWGGGWRAAPMGRRRRATGWEQSGSRSWPPVRLVVGLRVEGSPAPGRSRLGRGQHQGQGGGAPVLFPMRPQCHRRHLSRPEPRPRAEPGKVGRSRRPGSAIPAISGSCGPAACRSRTESASARPGPSPGLYSAWAG